MKNDMIDIKSKGVVVSDGQVLYEYPETMEEAIIVDGEEAVLKVYLQKRKTNFMDTKRKELTGGGIPSEIKELLKSADPVKLAKALEKLKLELEEDGEDDSPDEE